MIYRNSTPAYDHTQPAGRSFADLGWKAVGRKVDVEDLVGAAEIAERLNVRRPHLIHDWRRRYADFPEPVVTLKGTLIWSWREVEAWARSTGRI